jgi:hypothetical protein
MAEGALPNAAIPAGKDSTPAPTIDFTRLKISFVIVADPPPTLFEGTACFVFCFCAPP